LSPGGGDCPGLNAVIRAVAKAATMRGWETIGILGGYEGLLGWMFRQKKVKPFPIFLDSPMAIEATNIYTGHRELFDEGMTKFIAERPLRLASTRTSPGQGW